MFSKKGYQDPEHNSQNNDRLMIVNLKQLKRSFYQGLQLVRLSLATTLKGRKINPTL